MRVFVTGASGWIGSATVEELLAAGHTVTGLARSDASAAAIEAKGATVLRGDLDDRASIRTGAEQADAVVHLANKHDFTHPDVSNRAERDAVQTIGDVLSGSGRPFLMASGLAAPRAGDLLAETDPSPFHGVDSPRGGSENLALEFAGRDVRSVVARFAPTVHGVGDHGFIATLAGIARRHGAAGYIGDGTNRWAAVHRSDAVKLIRLGLENATAGTVLHAVAEEGVPTREIAEGIGAALGLPAVSIAPDDAAGWFGWIGMFFGLEVSASSALTRSRFGWEPIGPTLAEDLKAGAYTGA